MALYVNSVINITKGFFIVPEFGYYDYGDTSQRSPIDNSAIEDGDMFYFGAKWQINF
jgi:hypothetical protein